MPKKTPRERVAAALDAWEGDASGRLFEDFLTEAIEEAVQEAQADAAHARRSLKQACLFAVEGTALTSDARTIGPLWFAGWQAAIKAAGDAVAAVELDPPTIGGHHAP